MFTTPITRRKCDSCNQWIDGRPKICPLCNGYVDLVDKETDEKVSQQQQIIEAEKADFAAKPPLIRGVLRVVKFFQMIYLAIMSFIAWVIFWVAG